VLAKSGKNEIGIFVAGAPSQTRVQQLTQLPDAPFIVTTVRLSASQWLTDDDLAVFHDVPWISDLTIQYGEQLTSRGLIRLQELTSLTKLSLYGTPVGDDGLSAIKALTKLTYLGLGDAKITDEGLAELSGLSRLQILDLQINSGITGVQLRTIARMGDLR